MKAHVAYTGAAGVPLIDRVLTWSSYYTLVFTALCAFAPNTAAAAVVNVTVMLG